MGKHSKISPSTKWRLGGNVVLQLMECLIPSASFEIFMDNYFTCFRRLTHLGVTHRANFEQCTSGKKAVYLWQWLVRTTVVRFT